MNRTFTRRLERLEARAAATARAKQPLSHTIRFVDANRRVVSTLEIAPASGLTSTRQTSSRRNRPKWRGKTANDIGY